LFQGLLLFFVLACDTLIHYRIRLITGAAQQGVPLMDMTQAIILTIMTAATPLLLAAIGELVVERSGVLNLGVEGMMIMGAVAAFAVAQITGSAGLGPIGGHDRRHAVFAAVRLPDADLVANQVATGLALTILGLGLSGMIGEAFIGLPGLKLQQSKFRSLGHPVHRTACCSAGSDLLHLDPRCHRGQLVPVQEPRGPDGCAPSATITSAHALGVKVVRTRYLAVMFGGACAGLAGAHLSLVYTPQWVENMTAGRGWIALALVVFASWRPTRVLAGAYLFGAVSIGQFMPRRLGLEFPRSSSRLFPISPRLRYW
jgi:ABC-type uncharacterized transport system permease subunit